MIENQHNTEPFLKAVMTRMYDTNILLGAFKSRQLILVKDFN